jgi:hypothetical protein
MLNDPLRADLITNAAAFEIPTDLVLNFRVIPGGTNTAVVRVGDLGDIGDELLLKIGSQASSENKPIDTRRTVVRLQSSKTLAGTETKVGAYVQLIISQPKAGYVDTEIKSMILTLLGILVRTQASPYNVTGNDTIDRILSGEA